LASVPDRTGAPVAFNRDATNQDKVDVSISASLADDLVVCLEGMNAGRLGKSLCGGSISNDQGLD
jgi:hypothetical protein